VVPKVEGPKAAWPAPKVLEKWLMHAAKEADPGAKFLRRMLVINPSYGSYLSSNEELAELVMLFAKKFRSKIMQSESPIQPTTLYEPLCEIVWRVVGHVFNNIIHLQDAAHLPVPEMALGQVKMLLQTNEELSRQLKENRRAYLRELALLRDRERRLDENAQKAVQNLQEEPVMFYEPLSYVLDETTKAFVNEIVAERLKLGMKSTAVEATGNDSQRELEDLESELNHTKAECRHLRADAARHAANAKRLEELENQAKNEAAKMRKLADDRQKEIDELRAKIEELGGQLGEARNRKPEAPRPVQVISEKKDDGLRDELEELRRQLDEQYARARKLEEELQVVRKEKDDREREIQDLINTPHELVTQVHVMEAPKEVKVKEPGTVIKTVKDDSEIKRLTKQHEEIVRELRETIADLQEQLEDQKKKKPEKEPVIRKVVEKKAVKEEEPPEEPKKRPPKKGGYSQQELDDIVRQEKGKLQLKLDEKKAEIAALKEQIEELEARLKQYEKDMRDQDAANMRGEEELRNAKMWNFKYEEAMEKLKAAEEKYAILEQKVALLLEKLKHYGGEKAVTEALAEIKLEAIPVRRQRKKKAWERLYEDACNRIAARRKIQEELKAEEEAFLKRLQRQVKAGSVRRQVEALSNLHKAHQESSARYYDAASRFIERNADELLGDPSSNSDEDGYHEVCVTCGRRLPRSRQPAHEQAPRDFTPLPSGGSDRKEQAGPVLQSRRLVGSYSSGNLNDMALFGTIRVEGRSTSPEGSPFTGRGYLARTATGVREEPTPKATVRHSAAATWSAGAYSKGLASDDFARRPSLGLQGHEKTVDGGGRPIRRDNDRKERSRSPGIVAGGGFRARSRTDSSPPSPADLPFRQNQHSQAHGNSPVLETPWRRQLVTSESTASTFRHTTPVDRPAALQQGRGELSLRRTHMGSDATDQGAGRSRPMAKSHSGPIRASLGPEWTQREKEQAPVGRLPANTTLEPIPRRREASQSPPPADAPQGDIFHNEKACPARFSSGAGPPNPGVSLSRTVPLPAAGREIAAGAGSSAARRNVHAPTAILAAEIQSDRQKFVVTPLVSQQSMASGVPPPMPYQT